MGRKHKKVKRKHKKSKKYSDSDSSESQSTSEEEWVEKEIPKPNESNQKPMQREEWMSISSLIPTITRKQINEEKESKNEEKEDNKYMLDRLGQTERELNPYWKDGGTGLPAEKNSPSVESLRQAKTTVGDQGAKWLKKALRRAKEQAAHENRRLEDVVSERWGSLEKLEAMIANAEKNERNTIENESIHDQKHCSRSKKRDDYYQSSDSKNKSHEKNDTRRDHFDKVFYSKRQSDDNFRKKDKEDRYVHPQSSNYRNKDILTKNRYSKKFIKPTDDDVERNIFDSKCTGSKFGASSSRGWKKSEYKNSEDQNKSNNELNTKQINISSVDDKPEILSDKEMNELAAKVVKAEIMGNLDLAKELQKKLDSAQSARLNRPKGQAKDDDETVILTKTNSMGFTHPLTIEGSHLEPTRGRRKGQKMETHKDGKRMRYFADDDKYSLQDMFQREKLSTVEDHNEMFAKLASKGVGRDESARDMDDVFEETARVKESEGKSQARERDRAIKEHKRMERALSGCEWCLDNNLLLRHLIIAIGNKCYLCLPPYESLTMGHCLIIPTYHVTCATLLDEDVWDEIQIFRKSLTNMFKEQDEDVIFFESAMYFKHMPHMVLHCVPMAKETGDLAPIYFKKAIMESEKEWSNNKKIVDLSGKNVRLAVPKGLPYFAVDFGLQPGYAHVIEDEKLFPKNFAQEIIGGMLDLDHSLWRKPRKEKLEQQTKKVIQFTKQWKDFDCTKNKLQC